MRKILNSVLPWVSPGSGTLCVQMLIKKRLKLVEVNPVKCTECVKCYILTNCGLVRIWYLKYSIGENVSVSCVYDFFVIGRISAQEQVPKEDY